MCWAIVAWCYLMNAWGKQLMGKKLSISVELLWPGRCSSFVWGLRLFCWVVASDLSVELGSVYNNLTFDCWVLDGPAHLAAVTYVSDVVQLSFYYYLLLSMIIYDYLLLSIIIYYYLLWSIILYYYLLLSIIIYYYLLLYSTESLNDILLETVFVFFPNDRGSFHVLATYPTEDHLVFDSSQGKTTRKTPKICVPSGELT